MDFDLVRILCHFCFDCIRKCDGNECSDEPIISVDSMDAE